MTFGSDLQDCEMREVILINLSDYNHLKDIKRKYLELQAVESRNFFQDGQGNVPIKEDFEKIEGLKEAQRIEDLKREHELKTPILIEENPFAPTQFDPTKHVRSSFKQKARDLVSILEKHKKQISWDRNGNLFINEIPIRGAKIQNLLPKVFFGVRNSSLPGEAEFFRKLKTLQLTRFIRSVHKKDRNWFLLGYL